MRMFAIAVCAVACTAAAMAARAEDHENGVIEALTAEAVVPVLREIGAERIRSQDTGRTTILAFSSGGTPHFAVLRCSGTVPCVEIAILTLFLASAPDLVEVTNEFNKKHDNVTAYWLGDGRYVLKRSLSVAGGTTTRNIAINISSFVDRTKEFIEYFERGKTASGGDDADKQLSASSRVRVVGGTEAEIESFLSGAEINGGN